MIYSSNNSIFESFILHINRNIFRHLKLEIALAISASNEWKIESNNLTAQRSFEKE